MSAPQNAASGLDKVRLTPRATDYSQWYLDVARLGEMFEYSPTPGCINFLPKATLMWEAVRARLDPRFKAKGVQNVMLPMMIPMSFFEKEKEHVEGFAPEFAIVTHGGGKELDEKLVIRPTSETMFCDFFKRRLTSWRDLPILNNQWCNVVRWEKRTRPFLRTAEFHWQEGHTLHETHEEAEEFALAMMRDEYAAAQRDLLAIDGLVGRKSESEKFAGAEKTFTYEAMMSNGWALQSCTSHVLAQGFMEQFDVGFLNREGVRTYPFYTSWGTSTRMLGGLISSHSDDKGLVIPPAISEYKAVIVPIYSKDNKEPVDAYAWEIAKSLCGQGSRVPVKGQQYQAWAGADGKALVDLRDARMGEKLADWELSGYPVRVDCGGRDLESRNAVVASRVTGEKKVVPFAGIPAEVERMLAEGQKALFDASAKRLRDNTVGCRTEADLAAAVENGKFAVYEWDRDAKFEAMVKEKYKATTRCIPLPGQFTDAVLDLKNPANARVVFARAF